MAYTPALAEDYLRALVVASLPGLVVVYLQDLAEDSLSWSHIVGQLGSAVKVYSGS